MLLEECFQLGHISRLHGYKGAVVAFFDTDRPEAYTTLESVLIENDGELIPFQPLFKIINAEQKEILVPAIDDFIESIDREKKEIHLILPEGLLEVYS